jgi:hypothetical protein
MAPHQRTQVYLEAELHRNARKRAAEQGVSLSEYVRRLVARDLDRPAPTGDRSRVFDLGDSGGSDVARHKQDYIGEALEAEHDPRGRRP